jgi:hypothetical protein
MVVAFIDSLATYYRYKEAIEQTHQNNGKNCKTKQYYQVSIAWNKLVG